MSLVVLLVAVFLLLAYVVLIFIFQRGWKNIPTPNYTPTIACSYRISVVVCCKNEAHHLPRLIAALKHQQFKQFELVWVNDHSEDTTQQIMESTVALFGHVQVIQVSGNGKKQALKAGILAASGNFIVTTDADCVPGENWLASIALFQEQSAADLIIAPIKFYQGSKLFTSLQQLEFATLVGSGIAAAGADMPILCNAGNMAFTKQAWLDSANDLHEEEISGDDIFLLLSIKKRHGTIAVLKSPEAMVVTTHKKSLRTFIEQRRRWASKSTKYTDVHMLATAFIVAGVNLLQLFLFVLAVFLPAYWHLFLAIYVIKLVTDYSFLRLIQPLFLFRLQSLHVLVMSLLYPVYILVIGFSSVLSKKKEW